MKYTHFPVPNYKLADAIIFQQAPKIDDEYGRMMSLLSVDHGFQKGSLEELRHNRLADRRRTEVRNVIVDSFMQRHPRGKNTHGDRAKREFYAVCYAIKAHMSASLSHRNYRASKAVQIAEKLSDQAAMAIADLPSDSANVVSDNFSTAICELFSHRCVEYVHNSAGIGDLFLTDLGLMVKQEASAIATKKEKLDRQAQAKSDRKRLRDLITSLSKDGYGLQGIQEDHGHDHNAYNYHAMNYFQSVSEQQRRQAREALDIINRLEIGND